MNNVNNQSEVYWAISNMSNQSRARIENEESEGSGLFNYKIKSM